MNIQYNYDAGEVSVLSQQNIAIRAKKYGISFEHAKDPRSVTWLGRLNLSEKLSEEQYNASQDFLRLRNDFLKTIGAQSAIYEKKYGHSCREDYEAYVQVVKKDYYKTMTLIRKHNLEKVVEWTFIRDIEMVALIPSVQKVCDLLSSVFMYF